MANDTKIVKRAFNAGKVSRSFKWRNDVEKHAYACEELKNFYVDILGGIKRRQGTKLLNVFDDFYTYVRLVPFEYRRNFGRVLAFKENIYKHLFRCSTTFFKLDWSWSICFDIPDDLIPDKESVLYLKIGRLCVYLNNDNSLTILGLKGKKPFNVKGCGNKVVITFEREECSNPDDESFIPNQGTFRVYRSSSEKADVEYNDVPTDCMEGNIKLTGYSKTKELGDIRIFSIAIDTADSFFSVADYFYGSPDMLHKDFDINITEVAFNNACITSDDSAPGELELSGSVLNYKTLLSYAEDEGVISASTGHDLIDKGVAFGDICLPRGANITFNIDATVESSNCEASIGEIKLFKSPTAPDKSIEDTRWVHHYIASPETGFNEFGASPEYDFISNVIERWDDNAVEGFTISFSVYNDKKTDVYVDTKIALSAKASVSIENIFNGLAITWDNPDTLKMDVFDVNGTVIIDSVDTPLTADSINEFQYKQAGGYLYFAHSSFKPQRLSVGNEDYSFEDAAFFEPTLTDKEKGLKFSFVGKGSSSADISLKGDLCTITANSDIFSIDSIGEQFKAEYTDKFEKIYVWRRSKGKAHESKPFTAQGEIEVAPQGGAWGGTLKLMESTDNGATWNEIGRTTSINGSDNSSFIREVYDTSSIFKLSIDDLTEPTDDDVKKWSPNDLGLKFNLKTNATASVWFEIVGYTDARTATARLLNPCAKSFDSTAVYKSCWNKVYGFPRSVDIHEERLMFGGNENQPSTVWLSETNNWSNFRSISKLDTDSLAYTLATDDGEPIAWLVSKSDIMIGTANSEWSLGSRDAGQALTAEIVSAKNQSADGVEYIQPAQCENMVVYVRRGGIELSSIAYDFANDSYASNSLSIMNPELLSKGVIQIFNQLTPRNRIWAIDKEGGCFVFDFDKANNVAAWSEMEFGEGVVSGCVVSTSNYKSVFLAVRRDGYTCLERLDPNEANNENWLDCVPVSSGMETRDVETSVKYESVVRTTPIFLEGNVKVFDVKLYLLNSLGGKFRIVGFDQNGDECEDEWRSILPREIEFLKEVKPRNYRYVGACDTGYLEEGAIEVSTNEVAPFELTAIGIKAKG